MIYTKFLDILLIILLLFSWEGSVGAETAREFVYQRLRQEEGVKPTIYKDTKGKRTVGIGFNVDDPEMAALIPKDVLSGSRPMTELEMQMIARQRIALAERDARSFVGNKTFDSLDPMRQDVLIDMAYNMGKKSLQGFENTKNALQKGDYARASREILDSDYARKDAPNRALRNASIMKSGWWENNAPYMRYETMSRSK